MGWWRSERGVIGDAPADSMDAFLSDLERCYQKHSGRQPTQGEVADLDHCREPGEHVRGCRVVDSVLGKT
jgi:hypothetical protein